MNTSELRLGNIVSGRNDPPMIVANISKGTVELYCPGSESDNFSYDDTEIVPVILTKELLVNLFGFKNERYESNEYHIEVKNGMATDFVLEHTILKGESKFSFYIAMVDRCPLVRTFKYVNDLQNFFYSFWEYDLPYNSERPLTGAIATKFNS